MVSLPWRKKTRRLPLKNRNGDIKFIAPGHEQFTWFTGGDTWMHYLLPNGQGPAVGVFQRFDAVVDKFSADFDVWDLLDITCRRLSSIGNIVFCLVFWGIFRYLIQTHRK